MYIRNPIVAGEFYPEDSKILKSQILKFLDDAKNSRNQFPGKVIGVIAPHAGYIFSGLVAAYAYTYLQNTDFDGFVVIAPSHRGRFDGASIIPEGEYATPLGKVPIDSQIGTELLKEDCFSFIPHVHQVEHSLEVQVPFIQVVKENAKIVPVIIGSDDFKNSIAIGNSIASILSKLNKNYGIIVSTDLSHYHNYHSAVKIDGAFIKELELFDVKKLKTLIDSGGGEACGASALYAGMTAIKSLGANEINVVKYANSGDAKGPKNQVVGYLAAIFTNNEDHKND